MPVTTLALDNERLAGGTRRMGRAPAITAHSAGALSNRSRRPRVHYAALRLTHYPLFGRCACGASAPDRCLRFVVETGFGRSDIAIVSVVVAQDGCRASVLQASNGFDQLKL